jgi:NAD(P)-dependent dehydrogenase (short-subunit alcohol dehydrogenase family)
MEHHRRVAVVTGANRGIGFEIVRQLAREGIHVVLTSRDEAKGQAARQELESEGLDVTLQQLDVADPASIRRLRKSLVTECGRLDILVNNAGILLDNGIHVLDVDLDMVRETVETNVYGPLLLCQALVPLMEQNGYGRIVNVSSGMGQLSDMGSGNPAYRLSKTALNAVTAMVAAQVRARSEVQARNEVRGHNILINSMCPGWVRTDMGGSGAPRSVAQGADTALWLATLPDDGPTGGFFRDRKPIPW